MSDLKQVDRSIAVIFDLEGFSKANPVEQGKRVKFFFEHLNSELQKMNDLYPDSFSTGDGAIVSIGRKCEIETSSTTRFIDFVIRFVSAMAKQDLSIRAAINYSERDWVLVISDFNSVQGEFIQVGDTINIAARILAFCEPKEIIINKSVYDLLHKLSLENQYCFYKNNVFVTKHNVPLATLSYIPKVGEVELYNPSTPAHDYKIYSYFPPLNCNTLEYYMKTGLDAELKKVISNSFEALYGINHSHSLISYNNVMQVLVQLRYDPTDKVYVLSRNDRASGFWTYSRKNMYINYLKANAQMARSGCINQTRIIVYDDCEENQPVSPDDIIHDLKKLHATDSLFGFPSTALFPYELLNDLIFGFTISTKYGYAIIPIPAQDGGSSAVNISNIQHILKYHIGYDVTDGPLKAIITSDEDFIKVLTNEFERLMENAQIKAIR